MAVFRYLSVAHGIGQYGSRTRYKGQWKWQGPGAVPLQSADEYHVCWLKLRLICEVGDPDRNGWKRLRKGKKVVVCVLGKRKGEQTMGEANL